MTSRAASCCTASPRQRLRCVALRRCAAQPLGTLGRGFDEAPSPLSQYKLCRVRAKRMGEKGVPMLTLHDGKTIRYPDPVIKENDTVMLDIATNKITETVRFDVGQICMITGGRNTGRVGTVQTLEKHKGSFTIAHIKDSQVRALGARESGFVPPAGCLKLRACCAVPAPSPDPPSLAQGAVFTTRSDNVFVIGTGSKPLISLPKGKGVKLSIVDELLAKKKAASA